MEKKKAEKEKKLERIQPVWWRVCIDYAIRDRDGQLWEYNLTKETRHIAHARVLVETHMKRYERAIEDGRAVCCNRIGFVGL